MRRYLDRLLAGYGQRVTVERAEPLQVQAFLQPLVSRDETAPAEAVSLGMLDGRRWMYLGAEEVCPGEVLRCHPGFQGGQITDLLRHHRADAGKAGIDGL